LFSFSQGPKTTKKITGMDLCKIYKVDVSANYRKGGSQVTPLVTAQRNLNQKISGLSDTTYENGCKCGNSTE